MQIFKNWTNNGVTFGIDAAKSANDSNYLVIMCVRLLQKIGLLYLTNQTRFKKMSGENVQKLCAITAIF